MRKTFFLLLIFVVSHGYSLCFQDFLQKGEKGDFFITVHQKMLSLILIREKTDKSLIMEEIAVPEDKKPTSSWKEWIEKNAPGNISWLIFSLNLQTHAVNTCYSYTDSLFLELSEDAMLLPKLCKLPLTFLPEENRKKIGPPPLAGETDRRALFSPSTKIEGISYKGPYQVFRGVWPKDGTPFADKVFDFYFADNRPFPFWIHIDAGHITIMFRVIDSGKNMISPKPLPFAFQKK